jgi:hypothetical protein
MEFPRPLQVGAPAEVLAEARAETPAEARVKARVETPVEVPAARVFATRVPAVRLPGIVDKARVGAVTVVEITEVAEIAEVPEVVDKRFWGPRNVKTLVADQFTMARKPPGKIIGGGERS